MPRPSPGIRRTVAILNFFAAHPGQSFTLTDLVRALRLSRATCHSLLAGLVEAGYLYRTNDKSYVLGPTLIAIARIAAEHFSPLQVAQPEMRMLADEFDVICSAFFREGDDVVERARAAAVSHLDTIPQGARLRLRAPFGAIYYAWSPPEEADNWLDHAALPATPEHRQRMREGMAFTRQYGFSWGMRNASAGPSSMSTAETFLAPRPNYEVSLGTELQRDKEYPLAFLVAPVFNANHDIEFVMALRGFTRMYKGAAIERIGQRLVETCQRITRFIAGQLPNPPGR
jgi:DNA-binding IclR family transcriptional regulator